MSNGHEVLYVKEAARMLRISYRMMLEILRTGKGPPHAKYGSAIRIDAEGFQEWRRVGTGGRVFNRKKAS